MSSNEPEPRARPPFGTRVLRRLRIARRRLRLRMLRVELKLMPREAQRLFVLTLAIGALCGLAAVAFHEAIDAAQAALIERALAAPGRSWIAWSLAVAAAGGLACGAFLHFLVPAARGSGIPEVKAAFVLRERRIRLRDAAGKFAACTLQIGSGASLGREGPTVHICAALAGLLGRFARLPPRSLRRLLPVGAAAGIAAAFNAPLAAVTFAIEEIVGDLDRGILSGVIVAAAIAAAIERGVLGEHPVFAISGPHALDHLSSLAIYAVLGVAAALVSVAFTDLLLTLRRRFRALRWLPAWAKPAAGTVATVAIAIAATSLLGASGIHGGGYATLLRALDGGLAARAMLVLCACKVVATALSYGSGGAGGIFAPSLFVGGMLGGAVGLLDERLLGHASATGSFALVGMGAVFAGAIRAPITSVLMIVEMTGGYSLILPLMLANMTAYALARRLRPTPIYDALLEQDGVRLGGANAFRPLETMRLAQLVERQPRVVTFAPGSSGAELLARANSQQVYPVVDQAGALVGLVTDEELATLRAQRGLERIVVADDVMRAPIRLLADDDLRTAIESLLAHELPRLPVVDDDGRIVGLVDEPSIARAWLRAQRERSH